MGTLAWAFCALLFAATAGNAAAPDATPEAARYTDPQPEQFMTRWLVCGPFPVLDGEGTAPDEAAQKKAFDLDFLPEHGGEAQIQPAPGLTHHWHGSDYRWQPAAGAKESIDLLEVCGRKEYAVAYAWAEIEMPAPKTLLLGIGSDDAVKVWLNGEHVHENWTFRTRA